MSDTSHNEYRSWPIIILVITLAYLAVELSFSSTLLNIVSTQASPDEVDHIERWGRLISGFAAGLVFWSVFTPKLLHGVFRAFLLNIIVTTIVMIAAFHWEKSIVDNAQTGSSGSERKMAVYAAFLRGGLINETLSLDGMPSGDNIYTDADGKAFIALSPLLTITQSSMKGRMDEVINKVVTEGIRNSVGGSRGFYNTVFISSAHEMNRAWGEYLGLIHKLNHVRQQANRVPSTVESNRIIHQSRQDFDKAIAKAFSVAGEPVAKINPNSIHNSGEFFRNPVIARFWASKIGIKGIHPMMPNDSYEKIKRDVWPLFLKEKTDSKIREFNADPSEYADGESFAQKGKDAVALLAVPALALMLSVLFTLIHASKITYYLVLVVRPSAAKWLALTLAVTLSVVLMVTFDKSTTPITKAPLYTHLLAGYAAGKEGIWPAWSLTWVIQAERFIYPVAEATRKNILAGFNFGVTEK